MTSQRVPFGTLEWFDLVKDEMQQGVRRNPPPADFQTSLIERYNNAPDTADGMMCGFRIDIAGDALEFRLGVSATETADVVVEADYEAIRILVAIPLADPNYEATVEQMTQEGRFTVTGEADDMGNWTDGVHDRICDRTDAKLPQAGT